MEFAIAEMAVPVFEELIVLVHSFTDANFNLKPASGGWSAGQAAQHIRLATGNIIQLLESTAEETSRDPQENVEKLRSLFLDFDRKMQAPTFIEPEEKAYDRREMADFFQNLKSDLAAALETNDLAGTITTTQIPGFPYFTKVEWLAFIIFHTQRHIHQMRGITARI